MEAAPVAELSVAGMLAMDVSVVELLVAEISVADITAVVILDNVGVPADVPGPVCIAAARVLVTGTLVARAGALTVETLAMGTLVLVTLVARSLVSGTLVARSLVARSLVGGTLASVDVLGIGGAVIEETAIRGFLTTILGVGLAFVGGTDTSESFLAAKTLPFCFFGTGSSFEASFRFWGRRTSTSLGLSSSSSSESSS